MSIKVIKQFSGKKSESAASVAARLRARNKARAEALAKAKAAAKAKRNEDGEGDQVDDVINMDADSANVLFTDKDKNLQVVVGEDPEGGITVAVTTAEKDDIEEETVLTAVTLGEGEAPAEEGEPETEESRKAKADADAKAKAIEEARLAIKARIGK